MNQQISFRDDDPAAPWMRDISLGGMTPSSRRKSWEASQARATKIPAVNGFSTADNCDHHLGNDGLPQPTMIAARDLIVQCAADVAPESVDWLWPGRIAIGKQTLVAGEAGLGKSQLSIALIAAVTTGGTWPCGEGRAPLGNVVILSAEDGAGDTVIPRLMAAGADLRRVHLVSAVRAKDGKDRRAFDLSTDLGLLEHKAYDIGDVRMIVIDPISSYLGQKIDSHVNAAVRGALEPVGEMAARLRIAFVSITHPPKGTGTVAINRFIGSIAFVAAARAAFMVTRDPDDENRRLFLPVKNNLAPLGKGLAFRLEQRIVGGPDKAIVASSVIWDSEPVTITADNALVAADARGAGNVSARVEAEDFLKKVLGGKSVPVKDVQTEAKAAGLSWATIRRAKDRLDVNAERESYGRDGDGQWRWRMPAICKALIHPQDAHLPTASTLHPNEHLADGLPVEAGGVPRTDVDPGDDLYIPDFLRR